jgi:hypothetical protein
MIKHSVVVRIKDPETDEVVAGAFYLAPVREDGTIKYGLESCIVRDYMANCQGLFTSEELKAWMKFRPEPRKIEGEES